MSYLPHFSAYPEFDNNPFKPEGIGERWIEREAIRSKYVAIDEKTGEVMPLFAPPKKISVSHDAATYTKVFKKDIEKLTGSGKLVLLYIIYHIRPLGREVEVNMRTVTKWAGMSKASFYNGIRELLDRDIVCLKHRSKQVFFVNPNYVFNGNRTKMK
jgi:hypothetical protein